MDGKRFLGILAALVVVLGLMPGVALADDASEQLMDIKEGTYYIKAVNGNAAGKVLYWDEGASDQNLSMMFEPSGGSHADYEVWFITGNRYQPYSDDHYYGIYLYKDYRPHIQYWKDKCKRIEIDNLTGRDQPYLATTTGPHVFCGDFGNQDDAFRFYNRNGTNSYTDLIIESHDDKYRFFRHKEVRLFSSDLIYVKANTNHDTSDKLWELIPVNYIEGMSSTSPTVFSQRAGEATISWDSLRDRIMNSEFWSKAESIEIEYSTDREFLQNVETKRIGKDTLDMPHAESTLSLPEGQKTYYVRACLVDREGVRSNWSKTVAIGDGEGDVTDPTAGTYDPRRDYVPTYVPTYAPSYVSSYVSSSTSSSASSHVSSPAPSSGKTHAATGAVRRLAGTDRYATAAAVSSASFPSSSTAVVAAGTSFADALAASGLAGSLGCPVLLSDAGSLAGATSAELSRLGVTSVTLMGGEGALTKAVASELEAMGMSVTRVGGADRQATSVAAMRRLRAADSSGDTVVVASGSSFADALSIGPWAYATRSPILLAGPQGLSAEAVEAIRSDAGIRRALVVGGTSAVPAAVESQLAGLQVERVGGADRYQTSALVARWAASHDMGWSCVAVTTGRDFPDALAASALVGGTRGVLLLADGTAGPTLDLLSEVSSQVKTAYVLGGNAAVPASVEERVSQALS